MKHDSFAVFILSHGRPDKVVTAETLSRCGWRGKTFLVCDTGDARLDEYRARFGAERVLAFDKASVDCDRACNFTDLAGILEARNVCFDLAREIGFEYFLELDDDYTAFQFRYIDGEVLRTVECRDLSRVFDLFLDFLDCDERIRTVSMAQGGDLQGGAENGDVRSEKFYRKAMNSFFCRTDRRVEFTGLLNEDVSCYAADSARGHIYTQTNLVNLVQAPTQKNAGGITEAYRKYGTFTKSFFSVMAAPSCVRVETLGNLHRRIHHRINPRLAYTKILSEKWRRT